ncbi:TetR/AcrR family transcriptional regulator C-terminal ligand-binding domain-containing protein [Streptomyces sp. DW26H14]|uniref:TetR/AcrR family transcriptional regulator C-terminal ligand-binding domain-containing protein n=1 Tax=Streptomyces sp. DW26H14 TaxID=3435395 RepID=UPI00403D9247
MRENSPNTDARPRREGPILAATLEQLAEHGYRDLTMEGVASHAGVHKATLYRWWTSKGHLVGWALGASLSTGPIPDTGDTRKDLVTWLQTTIANYTSTAAGSALPGLLNDLARESGTLDSFRAVFLDERRANCAEVIQHGIDRGDIPADADVELFMDVLAGPVFYRQLMTGTPPPHNLAEQIVDLLLFGRVPREAPAPSAE